MAQSNETSPPPTETINAPPTAGETVVSKRFGDAPGPMRDVNLNVSSGMPINLPGPSASMFVADPTIADIHLPFQNRVFLYGKKPGRTTFYALRGDGSVSTSFNIVVSHNVVDLNRMLHAEFGDLPVTFTQIPQGIVLNGIVRTPEMAERVRTTALRFVGDGNALFNHLQVSGSVQVNLRVRVAEISKNVTKNLGINWSAIASQGAFTFGLATGRDFLSGVTSGIVSRGGGGGATQGTVFGGYNSKNLNITGVVDALAQEGLASVLAEPNLTAVSGEKASFLAGGEFPVPVVQGGQSSGAISVEYRRFGISLDFFPTVISESLISMKVKPEVSQLSDQGSVTLNNITIPALTTRRAETTVELGSGQSLVIGGLIQSNFSTSIDKFPGLGDTPVLGPLFRSSRFQKNESELVIIITPFVVRPVSSQNNLSLPTDLFHAPSDLERILEGRVQKREGSNAPVPDQQRLRGDAGFVLQ